MKIQNNFENDFILLLKNLQVHTGTYSFFLFYIELGVFGMQGHVWTDGIRPQLIIECECMYAVARFVLDIRWVAGETKHFRVSFRMTV